MRMAGQVWFPPANQMGEGCAKSPEKYPAPPKRWHEPWTRTSRTEV